MQKIVILLQQFIDQNKLLTAFVGLFACFFLFTQLSFQPRQRFTLQVFTPLYHTSQVPKMTALLITYTDSLISPRYFTDTTRRNALAKQLLKFYQYHNFRPVWLPAGWVLPKTDSLLNTLRTADTEGLRTQDYWTDSLRKAYFRLTLQAQTPQEPATLQKIAKLDVLLSASLLSFALHSRCGRITFAKEKYKFEQWQTPQQLQDSVALQVFQGLYRQNLQQTLAAFQPTHPQWKPLQKALWRYLQFAKKQPPVVTFDADSAYAMADSSAALVAMKQRLQLLGDLPSQTPLTAVFDSTLYRAVLRFRFRHALPDAPPQKLANKEMIELLNENPAEAINKIKINMERLKWKPYYTANKLLVVNIPDFRVYFYENQRMVSSMRVVVGKKTTPTPIFTDTMQYVIFNPTWSVPSSIASKEFLPKIRRNPAYLARNGYVLRAKGGTTPLNPTQINWYGLSENNFPYSITQKPSEGNALGKIKFIFPNKAQVYLHDTPEKKFFSRNKRAYSHGCIRVECPAEVANYVLTGIKDWNKEKIAKELSQKSINYVVLPKEKQILVVISYQTAWVDAAQHLHLRQDVYGHDKDQQIE